MRMTREAYAKEVWKVVKSVGDGHAEVSCPHEGCEKPIQVQVKSMQAGPVVTCPDHGVIYRA
jgi:hypothetical protein